MIGEAGDMGEGVLKDRLIETSSSEGVVESESSELESLSKSDQSSRISWYCNLAKESSA